MNKSKLTMPEALKKRKRLDSFTSNVKGVGGDYDLGSSLYFSDYKRVWREELENLYNKNWLANRIVDQPVEDMLSSWVSFIELNEEKGISFVEEVEKELKNFDAKGILSSAFKEKRTHYGSAIFFDYGDDCRLELKEPKKENLERIVVVNNWYCFPQTFYKKGRFDIPKGKINCPEHYMVIINSEGNSETLHVHHSRLLILQGKRPSSNNELIRRRGWGLSVLETAYRAISSYSVAMQGATDASGEFFWKTLQIEGLADLIAENDSDSIIDRARQAINALGGHNIGIYGEGEQLKRESASLSGLPEIIDRMANQVCASSDPPIPFSILFSAEGGALGGSSAYADQKNYYKRIKSMQETEGRQAIDKFLYFLGYEPKEISYVFNPIDEPTQKEKKEIEVLQSQIDEKYLDLGVILKEEVRESRFKKDEIDLNSYKINESFYDEIKKEEENFLNEEEN